MQNHLNSGVEYVMGIDPISEGLGSGMAIVDANGVIEVVQFNPPTPAFTSHEESIRYWIGQIEDPDIKEKALRYMENTSDTWRLRQLWSHETWFETDIGGALTSAFPFVMTEEGTEWWRDVRDKYTSNPEYL